MRLEYNMKLTRMKMNLDDIIYTKWSKLVRLEDLKTVSYIQCTYISIIIAIYINQSI